MPFPPFKRLVATRYFELPMAGQRTSFASQRLWNIRSIFEERAGSIQRLSEAFTERYFHPYLKFTLILFRHVCCILIGLRFSNSECDPDNPVFTTDCKRRNHKKSRRKMDKGLISVTTIPSSLSLPTARGKLASQADFV